MIPALSELFASPQWLWLLIPAIAIVVADTVRRWGSASLGRRIGGAAIRILIAIALLGALADPRWHERDDVGHLIVVVDRSASINDDALDEALELAEEIRDQQASDTRVGLVLFDATAEVAVFPGAAWDLPEAIRAEPVEATDIDAALRLALGLIPAQDGGEVVLLSDGRSTAGDDFATLAHAAERGVKIHTLAVEPARDDAAIGEVVLAEATVRPGAAVRGHVTVDGADERVRGTLRIRIGDDRILEQPVDLAPGERLDVPFEHNLAVRTDPGALPVTADFLPNRTDASPENNRRSATLIVGDPPQVRVFAGEPHDGNAMARALRAERMDVKVVAVDKIKPEDEDLEDVDLVVLANAPAASIGGGKALAPAFLDDLTHFVDAGGGLIVLGGPQSFDMGGYGHSALDRVLPVKLDPVDPEIEAGATILIILDRSGSMSAPVGFSKTKMQLADEGAAASIRLLRTFDRVGVMSVTETVRWEIPIQPVRDPAALERKVLRIRADGGGIFVYTSLAAAERALDGVSTPLKHVILFSDAADSEEKVRGVPFGTGPGPTAEDVAQRMRGKGITTSVIGIGTEDDVDTAFLKDLARSGGGRFYLTNDARKLRSLFVEETERLVDSSLHEVPFRPKVERAHEIVEGIDYARGPELRGYQELEARNTAEVVLTGPAGHPIMTTWRYGLGQVVTWASDASPRWAEGWLTWEGFSTQWTQAARFALRDRTGDDTAIEVDFSGSQARIRVARRDAKGLTIDEGGLRARLKQGASTREVSLDALEPGLWEAGVATEPGETYDVEVLGPDDKVLAVHTFAPPPSPERSHRSPDRDLLRDIATKTGGDAEPEAIAPASVASVTARVHQLWPWLLVLALCLLPLDALLRRPARVV